MTDSENKKPKRIFWLGMHKVLVKTELIRLRQLGYEVFNPPYLSSVPYQSAHLDWDAEQESSLPANVFKTLSQTNFFYVDEFTDEIINILHEYFDVVLVTIIPAWLAPIIKQYKGRIIYRVYGQYAVLTDEFKNCGIYQLVKQHKDFHFMPHAIETLDNEDAWLLPSAIEAPYCLTDDVFAYRNSWNIACADLANSDVALTCPNIKDPYYHAHYKLLKKHFTDPFYKFYGVQLEDVDDPAIVGTLARDEFLQKFQQSSCYVYSYHDPTVCYLPPIEAMVIGLPVLFPAGCLLDKYFNAIDTPARYTNFAECKNLVANIRSGDKTLINAIIQHQDLIIKRYTPSDVWAIFDPKMTSLIEQQTNEAIK